VIGVVSTRALGTECRAISGGHPHARISQTLGETSFRCSCVRLPFAARAADDTALTKEQIKQFLQTAEVIKSKPSSKGVTHSWRLTLSSGAITHDASFQPIDEHKSEKKLESGKVEFDFVDSHTYNIAAYQLAELVCLDDMLPVYFERKWQGQTGSLNWWLPVKMDDSGGHGT